MTTHAQSVADRASAAAPVQSLRIGIVAGGGSLPLAVAEAAQTSGFSPFIVGLRGNASVDIENFPHAYAGVGQLALVMRTLHRNGCKRVVFVGSLRRPNLLSLKFDSGLLRNLPRILRLFKGGDDSVLRGVARIFETSGFEMVAAHEVAPRLLAPAGVFSAAAPDADALKDIELGFKVARALGAFDIGQGAVVAHQYVLAVEAAEGTDAMLRRCRDLNSRRFKAQKGVLVKAPKPGQDLRFDLPAIGPRTVELAAEAGIAGVAVAAGGVLLAEQQELVEKADRLGLFLYGASPGEVLGG